MNPRLEQLRKRYLNPPMPGGSAVYTRGPRSIEPEPSEQEAAVSEVHAEAENPSSQESPPAEAIAEQNSDATAGEDSQPAVEETTVTDDLAASIAAMFEPARRYRDRVSLSFESIRSLQAELGALVQSLEPLKGLQDQIFEILNSIRAQLADLAMSLEAAKALRLQLSELVESLETGSEIQDQIHELSKALGAFQTKSANEENDSSEKAARAERRARA